jgi:mRNA-degrading endonuclease RelE of RelBE toxin-antitoxin system
MNWEVRIKSNLYSKIKKLPKNVQERYELLVQDLMFSGPHVNWPNFSKLKGKKNIYHCHIKKGKPTYVMVWEVKDKIIKLMEVTYVGTHEKASY